MTANKSGDYSPHIYSSDRHIPDIATATDVLVGGADVAASCNGDDAKDLWCC
jgi:hypothetical protein